MQYERKHNQQRIPKSQNEAQDNLRSFTGNNGCSNTNIAILQNHSSKPSLTHKEFLKHLTLNATEG